MRGHAHDGARAVVHQDVVRDPDGQGFLVVRILGVATCEDAVLFDFANVTDLFCLALLRDQLIDLGAQVRIVPGHVGHDGMLWRQLDRGGSIDSVDPRSEDGDG